MNDKDIIQTSIELGKGMALHACLRIKLAIDEETSAEGILALELKNLLEAKPPLMRDNMIEGFCDVLQRFIEHDIEGGATVTERLEIDRL